jgi:hypothetical protein
MIFANDYWPSRNGTTPTIGWGIMTRVFISHGHNEAAKLRLKEFVSQELQMEPVVLGEQPQRSGMTIIEALELFSEGCVFAVILLTGDDETTLGAVRGRQNVIHEIGYLQGRLRRKRVVLLKESEVELPSNLSGLFYLQFVRDVGETFEDLRKIIVNGDASISATPTPQVDSVQELLLRMTSIHQVWIHTIYSEIAPFSRVSSRQFLVVVQPILERHRAAYAEQALSIRNDLAIRNDLRASGDQAFFNDKHGIAEIVKAASTLLIEPSERVSQLCSNALILIENCGDAQSDLEETKQAILDMFSPDNLLEAA